MQLSSTWSEPASFAAPCAAMNYTWSPLRHLTAVSSGAYTLHQNCCSQGPCILCMLIKMGVHMWLWWCSNGHVDHHKTASLRAIFSPIQFPQEYDREGCRFPQVQGRCTRVIKPVSVVACWPFYAFCRRDSSRCPGHRTREGSCNIPVQ